MPARGIEDARHYHGRNFAREELIIVGQTRISDTKPLGRWPMLGM